MAFFLSFCHLIFNLFRDIGSFLLSTLSINTTYEFIDETFSVVVYAVKLKNQ